MSQFYLPLFLIFFASFLAYRDNRVSKYKRILMARIFELTRTDPLNDWEWRWQEFDRVSYYEMMFKFWKPVGSFYQDRSFLKP